MNALSREDILRELELLPVWQLRKPLPEVVQPIATVTAVEKATATAESIVIEKTSAENKPTKIATQLLRHVASNDGRWLFVLENHALSADETTLFNNMLRAMRIQSQPAVQADNTMDLVKANNTQWVIAMGEAVAQTLLQSTAPLTSLRGQLHLFKQRNWSPRLICNIYCNNRKTKPALGKIFVLPCMRSNSARFDTKSNCKQLKCANSAPIWLI